MNDKNLLFGKHAVLGVLTEHPKHIESLYLLKDRADIQTAEVIKKAEENGTKIIWLSRHALDELVRHQNHQGIAALCKAPPPLHEKDLEKILAALTGPALLLVLDTIQDPHNLGACLRSAAGFDAHAVIAPKDKSVGLTPAVCKVACGAAEIVPFIQVTNLARTLERLKELNIWVFGLTADAEGPVYSENLTGPIALVLGAEGKGLRRLTRESCDKLLKIPMQGPTASLNVSVAAAIGLYEVMRQRVSRLK